MISLYLMSYLGRFLIGGFIKFIRIDKYHGNIYLSGCFNIQKVTPAANGESAKVKVKVRVNTHGIFSVMSATQTEQLEDDGKEEENMDVDSEKKADAPPTAEAQVNGEVLPP